MNKLHEAMEEEQLRLIAQEYEQQGYRVVVRPAQRDRPEFLRDFETDLIACCDQENVVVEVRSRSDVAMSPSLVHLASVVNSMPGWRLDFSMVGYADSATSDDSAVQLRPAEIRGRLVSVGQILDIGQEEAAVVLAWSAAEATLRLLAAQNGVDPEHEQPAFLVQQLFSLGVLSRGDYDSFRDALRYRNLIVHGYRSPEPSRELVEALVGRVEALLHIEPVQRAR